MKKIVLWVASTVATFVLLFSYHTSTAGALAEKAAVVADANGVYSGSAPSAALSTAKSSAKSSAQSTAKAAPTKTYTGSVVQTQWGPMQVQITAQGSSITGVSVLQHPTGHHESDQINAYALPVLIDQTLTNQTGDVQMISGATITSAGYSQSLQSALDQAGL